MPNIVACLEHADSNAVSMAMLVLSNLLQLLEGKTLSLSALALAPKLRLLFDNVRLGESPVPPALGTSIHTHPPVLCRGMLCPTAPIAALGGSVLCPIPSLHGLSLAWSPCCRGWWWHDGSRAAESQPALAAPPSPPMLSCSVPQPCWADVLHAAARSLLEQAVLGTSISTSAPCLPWAWGYGPSPTGVRHREAGLHVLLPICDGACDGC